MSGLHVHALLLILDDPLLKLLDNLLAALYRVSVPLEEGRLEERRGLVDLELLCALLELDQLDDDLLGGLSVQVRVQQSLLLDELAEEEREKLLVIGGLVEVLSETLQSARQMRCWSS